MASSKNYCRCMERFEANKRDARDLIDLLTNDVLVQYYFNKTKDSESTDAEKYKQLGIQICNLIVELISSNREYPRFGMLVAMRQTALDAKFALITDNPNVVKLLTSLI